MSTRPAPGFSPKASQMPQTQLAGPHAKWLPCTATLAPSPPWPPFSFIDGVSLCCPLILNSRAQVFFPPQQRLQVLPRHLALKTGDRGFLQCWGPTPGLPCAKQAFFHQSHPGSTAHLSRLDAKPHRSPP